MAKAKRPRKARKAKTAPAALRARELNAASRAQLGRDKERRSYRPLPEDASVEDPLQDWPEDA